MKKLAITLVCLSLCPCCLAADANDEPLVVHVQPGQTLNAAIADVKGAVCAILPAGVTEHDAAITRKATVIVKGQGRDVSILRPAASLGPDAGVALVQHDEPFDGDLVLSDFTYDRAHQPGITPGGGEDVTTGATILHVGAEGRVILRNLEIFYFDFGAREDQSMATTAFLMARPGQRVEWVVSGKQPDEYHQKEIRFENVLIDFERHGGIRHRPGSQSRAFDFGLVDRLSIDADCVIRAHLCQDANPEYTVGPVWRGRGNAGTMYGMNAGVYEYAYIDGVYWNCDYGVSRSVSPVTEDAVIEWRMDVLNAGYGDQFWQGRVVDGGHMIFKDVRLEGNRTGELWNDYGLRAFGDWETITVEGCTVINRGHPLMFGRGKRLGQITIRDTTLAPCMNGRTGLLIQSYEHIGGLLIDGLTVIADPANPEAYYTSAVQIEDMKTGGPVVVNNLRADGFLLETLDARLGPDVTLITNHIAGERAQFRLPEGFDFTLTQRDCARPTSPRPDYQYGTELPGNFRGMDVMTAVRGDGNIRWVQTNMGYTKDGFHVYADMREEDIVPVRNDNFETADRLRLGLALGPPEDAKEWYEIEVAAAEGESPLTQTRVRVLRYPGVEVVDASGVQAGLVHHPRGAKRWGISIPWDVVGIDPLEEVFFIGRHILIDLAYIDVDDGKETAAYAFMAPSGVLEEKTLDNYKQAFLRGVNWDDTP